MIARRAWRVAWLVPMLVVASAAAQAQVHKCVDASGRTSYSQAACPENAAKAQTLVGGGAEARDRLLKDLLAIARHGSLDDVTFVQRTLGVSLERKSADKMGRTMYKVTPPAGSPATNIGYGIEAGRAGSSGFLQLTVDPARQCISQAQLVAAFGEPQNDAANGPDRQLIFEIRGGPYSTVIYAHVAQRPAQCAHTLLLRTGFPR